MVWQRAHEMTLDVYALTRSFAPDDLFGLVSQMRRASISIPTNLSEGCGCSSDLAFAQFVEVALRSACEVEYQLLLCRDLKYLSADEWKQREQQIIAIKRMLSQLMKTLRNDRTRGSDERRRPVYKPNRAAPNSSSNPHQPS